MANYAQIEVEIKGVKYTTEATDSAGILFLSVLFNEDETQLIKQGRMEDAVAMYSDRAASRMRHKLDSAKTPEDKVKVEEQLNSEITMELWQRMERNWEARSAIAERIVELFRFAKPHAIPKEQVFYQIYKEGEKQYVEFGINLSATDLISLFSAIVGPTLADINKKKEPEISIQEPVIESKKELSIEVGDAVPIVPVPTLAELKEQRAAINKVLEGNPSQEVRIVLEAQLRSLDEQVLTAS